MISEVNVKKYCKDYKNIENYDLAMNDTTQVWECHHRLETETSEGKIRPRKAQLSHKELVALGMYYDRPSEELIFLTRKEHKKTHRTTEVTEDFGSKKNNEKDYMKSYYEVNKDKLQSYSKAHRKAYYEANKDKLKSYSKACQKAYREKNIDKIKVYDKVRDYVKHHGIVTDLSKLPKRWTTEDIEYYKKRYF